MTREEYSAYQRKYREAHGAKGKAAPPRPRAGTEYAIDRDALKAEVARLGLPYWALAKRMGVSEHVIRQWVGERSRTWHMSYYVMSQFYRLLPLPPERFVEIFFREIG